MLCLLACKGLRRAQQLRPADTAAWHLLERHYFSGMPQPRVLPTALRDESCLIVCSRGANCSHLAGALQMDRFRCVTTRF